MMGQFQEHLSGEWHMRNCGHELAAVESTRKDERQRIFSFHRRKGGLVERLPVQPK
jgi:hypothetical protein